MRPEEPRSPEPPARAERSGEPAREERPVCADSGRRPPATFDARGKLDLPEALLVKEGEARVLELAPCITDLALSRGTLYVHARNLQGGSLQVRTLLADVRVLGTAFAVHFDGQGLGVAVVEGSVELVRSGRVIGRAQAGQRLDGESAGELRQLPLQAELRKHIEERLGLRPASAVQHPAPARPRPRSRPAGGQPAAPPAQSVDFEVERVWRRGAAGPSRELDVGGPPLELDGTPRRNWKLNEEER